MRRISYHHRRTQRGMTLLEVMLALGIFVTVAFSLVLALNTALDVANERNAIDQATRGLENQVALLHAIRIVPTDKDLPDDGSGVLYHLLIEPEQMQDQKKAPVAGMYRATITAKWKSGNHIEDRSVSELLYQP